MPTDVRPNTCPFALDCGAAPGVNRSAVPRRDFRRESDRHEHSSGPSPARWTPDALTGNAAIARLLAAGPSQLPPAIARSLAARGSSAQLARVSDEALDARETMGSIRQQADDLLERHRGDPEALATAVLNKVGADWEATQVAYRVLDAAAGALAELLSAIARRHDEAALRAATGPTRQFLQAIGGRLRVVGKVAEAERFIRVLVSPEHAHLLGETATASAPVQGALGPHHATVQSVASGVGPVVYDEYWIVLDAMPPNLTAERYLEELSTDVNRAVADDTFNQVNVFRRTRQDQQRGAPAVGDVYDIDIQGPDNGSVMLVESTPSHFVFQTVATPLTQTGTHPEFGSREFGFQRIENGAVRFYTRGVSRPGSEIAGAVGAPIQARGWTALLTGIGNALQSRGGRLRTGSFGRWIRRG